MIHGAVGIDPGLVDTGVVILRMDPDNKRWGVEYEVFKGFVNPSGHREVPTDGIIAYVNDYNTNHLPVYIEAYRPRSHFQGDAEIGRAVNALKTIRGASTINNTGMKKVVTRGLLELLNMWRFSTPTHHQDLRSAAQVLLFGMLKSDEGNALLVELVEDHIAGITWAQEAYI